MEELEQDRIKKRYMDAVDSLLEKLRDDPNVIAVIVGGSLAYDVVWEKSDIDMTVIIRDQQLKNTDYCLVEDGITINVELIPRSSFKRVMEKSLGGSFVQSYMSKGMIVYSTDESLNEYFEENKSIGTDDMALSMFYKACEVVSDMEKCKKWLKIRKDPLYAQYYLVKTAEKLADMELCAHAEPSSRAAIQKALEWNPEVIKPFYQDAMSHHLSEEEITAAMNVIDRYLEHHMDMLKRPVLELMSDGEIKTLTLIAKHFHTQGHFIVNIFDYLAEKGVLEKVSQTTRLTPKGRLGVEELGYLYIP